MSEWAQPGPFMDVIQRQREYAAFLHHQERLAAVRRRVEEEGRAGPNDLTEPGPGPHAPVYLHEKSIGVRTNIVWRWSCECGGDSRRPMRSRKQAERSWSIHREIMEAREQAS